MNKVYKGSWILGEKIKKHAPGFIIRQLLEELVPEVS